MEKLTIDIFLQSAADPELSRYKVLAEIRKAGEMLNQNKLYPEFAEMISIYNLLNAIIQKRSLINEKLPERLIGFDLNEKKGIYGKEKLSEDKVDKVFDFINWAMPKIKEIIEEGKVIFDFVDENMKVNEVGILPIYKKEGYFFIPDITNETLYTYRYEMILFPAESENLHTLKTNLLEEIDIDELITKKPENHKVDLVKKYPELPNPAAFNFDFEFDFPFKETILPVAKRKLLRKLAA